MSCFVVSLFVYFLLLRSTNPPPSSPFLLSSSSSSFIHVLPYFVHVLSFPSSSSLWVLKTVVRLIKAKKFDPRKTSNKAMIYAFIGMFGFTLYQFSVFYIFMRFDDTGSTVMDRLKPMGTAIGTLAGSMSILEICVVWITLVLASKKSPEGLKKIKIMVYYVRFVRGE